MKLQETAEQLKNNRLALDETSKNLQLEKVNAEEMRARLSDVEAALNNHQQMLTGKQDRIIYLENLLREIKDQNEMLQASVADYSEKSANQQQLLDDEQSRNLYMEQKLTGNKRLLQKLFSELSACIQEDGAEPPIIPLRPAYINKIIVEEWEEKAVQ